VMINMAPDCELIGYILRHGETVLNANNCWRGWENPPLNEKGTEAAEAAGHYLGFQKLGRIVSSDLLRASQTAEIVMSCASVECPYISYDPNLRPWAISSKFAGMEKTAERLKDFKFYIDHPDVPIPPDGESLNQHRDRNEVIFPYLATPYKGLPTLVVCHTSNVTAAVRRIDEETFQQEEWTDVVEPGGLIAVYMDGKGTLSVIPVLGAVKTEPQPEAS